MCFICLYGKGRGYPTACPACPNLSCWCLRSSPMVVLQTAGQNTFFMHHNQLMVPAAMPHDDLANRKRKSENQGVQGADKKATVIPPRRPELEAYFNCACSLQGPNVLRAGTNFATPNAVAPVGCISQHGVVDSFAALSKVSRYDTFNSGEEQTDDESECYSSDAGGNAVCYPSYAAGCPTSLSPPSFWQGADGATGVPLGAVGPRGMSATHHYQPGFVPASGLGPGNWLGNGQASAGGAGAGPARDRRAGPEMGNRRWTSGVGSLMPQTRSTCERPRRGYRATNHGGCIAEFKNDIWRPGLGPPSVKKYHSG